MINPEIIGFIGGIITITSFIPQLIKSIKTKSTGDISIPHHGLIVSGVIFWVAYGVMIESPSVLVTNVIFLCLTVPMLMITVKYRSKTP